MSSKSFRYYEQEYPEAGDLVTVRVNKITEMGAYCSLLEYNNQEGMIMKSELSRRRIRSVHKLIHEGRIEILVVLRVNKEKGFIDLSKKRVDQTPLEKKQYAEKYSKAKAFNSIIRHLAMTAPVDPKPSMKQLYKWFGWEMLREHAAGKDPFKLALDGDKFFEKFDQVPENLRAPLLRNFTHRLKPQICKIRAEIECKCVKLEGIDAIKAALEEALKLSVEGMKLEIRLYSTPLYVLTTNTSLKDKGLELLDKAIGVVREHLEGKGGVLSINTKPKVVDDYAAPPNPEETAAAGE